MCTANAWGFGLTTRHARWAKSSAAPCAGRPGASSSGGLHHPRSACTAGRQGQRDPTEATCIWAASVACARWHRSMGSAFGALCARTLTCVRDALAVASTPSILLPAALHPQPSRCLPTARCSCPPPHAWAWLPLPPTQPPMPPPASPTPPAQATLPPMEMATAAAAAHMLASMPPTQQHLLQR